MSNMYVYTKQYLDSDGTWHYIVKKTDGIMEYYLNAMMKANTSEFNINLKDSFYNDNVMFFIRVLGNLYDAAPIPLSYFRNNIRGQIASPIPNSDFWLFGMMIGKWK